MITPPADQRISAYAPVEAPQPVVPAGVFLAHPRQIWRRREDTQSAIVFEREMRFEGSIKLARTIVARPYGVVIHVYGYYIAGEPYSRSGPTPTPQIMCKLPRAEAADNCKYKRAARLEEARTFSRHVGQVGYAIERAEIGIGTIIDALPVETLQFMSAHRDRPYPIGQILAFRTVAGPPYHLRRPIGSSDMMSDLRHADGIKASAAAQIDQSAARGEGGVQPAPHFAAHFLNKNIVAARTVIVCGDAVERFLSVAQLRCAGWVHSQWSEYVSPLPYRSRYATQAT